METRRLFALVVVALAVVVLATMQASACFGGRFRDRDRPRINPLSYEPRGGSGRLELRIEDERRGILPWRTDRRSFQYRYDPPAPAFYGREPRYPRGYCPSCGR